MRLESRLPPTTAINVARKCPAVAPVATPTGFCAAPNGRVIEKKHSIEIGRLLILRVNA
jgi:hypothetical protein